MLKHRRPPIVEDEQLHPAERLHQFRVAPIAARQGFDSASVLYVSELP
jgi:hypothetical protein